MESKKGSLSTLSFLKRSRKSQWRSVMCFWGILLKFERGVNQQVSSWEASISNAIFFLLKYLEMSVVCWSYFQC